MRLTTDRTAYHLDPPRASPESRRCSWAPRGHVQHYHPLQPQPLCHGAGGEGHPQVGAHHPAILENLQGWGRNGGCKGAYLVGQWESEAAGPAGATFSTITPSSPSRCAMVPGARATFR